MFSTPADSTTFKLFKAFTGQPLLSFIGDRSFIAIGSAEWASKARQFPGVVTASPRSSESKISPETLQALKASVPAAAQSPKDASARRVRSLALCYGPAGCRHALDAVAHLPCTTYLHDHILEMHCLAQDASAAVAAAASSPGVYWIEPKTAISARNWSGKSIIGTGSSHTFTSASAANPSKVFSTVSLQNSVIGVADSGISINNCYFCSLNISQCSSATGSTSARNIKKYPQLCFLRHVAL